MLFLYVYIYVYRQMEPAKVAGVAPYNPEFNGLVEENEPYCRGEFEEC